MAEDLDTIIDRATTLCTYGNATHIPELAGMVLALAKQIKEMDERLKETTFRVGASDD